MEWAAVVKECIRSHGESPLGRMRLRWQNSFCVNYKKQISLFQCWILILSVSQQVVLQPLWQDCTYRVIDKSPYAWYIHLFHRSCNIGSNGSVLVASSAKSLIRRLSLVRYFVAFVILKRLKLLYWRVLNRLCFIKTPCHLFFCHFSTGLNSVNPV